MELNMMDLKKATDLQLRLFRDHLQTSIELLTAIRNAFDYEGILATLISHFTEVNNEIARREQ